MQRLWCGRLAGPQAEQLHCLPVAQVFLYSQGNLCTSSDVISLGGIRFTPGPQNQCCSEADEMAP